jgi:hypothetical protein
MFLVEMSNRIHLHYVSWLLMHVLSYGMIH